MIANIPYYITSPILFHFLYPKSLPLIGEVGGSNIPPAPLDKWGFNPPAEMTIMMQEEVGEKILE